MDRWLARWMDGCIGSSLPERGRWCNDLARERRSRSSSLCLLLADCDLCAAGFLVSHCLGCGFFGGLGIFVCIGIYLVRICGRIDGGDGLWLWRIPCGDKKQKLKKTLVRLDTCCVFFLRLFLKPAGLHLLMCRRRRERFLGEEEEDDDGAIRIAVKRRLCDQAQWFLAQSPLSLVWFGEGKKVQGVRERWRNTRKNLGRFLLRGGHMAEQLFLATTAR